MPVRVRLEVDRVNLGQTKKTIRRLVKESPALIANELAKELKQGDGGAGAFPNPARPDRKTGYPVRTGLARRSFRPTHDGRVTNTQGYTGKLEREGKWSNAVKRYIEARLIAIARQVRDKALRMARRG